MTITGEEKFTCFPKHVAIIMDGNRRWARQHKQSVLEGHRAGAETLRTVLEQLGEYRLPFLTVYSFSTENWSRSKDEVRDLFMLVEQILQDNIDELHRNGIKVRHLGRLAELPENVQKVIKHAVELTENNRNLTLNFAFNYGGRTEIVDAVRGIINDGIESSRIDEKIIDKYLYTCGIPDVDLVIRTGGETRLSNYLTWQTTYSEIYFTDVLWPDFNSTELDKALLFYSTRQRRFGGG